MHDLLERMFLEIPSATLSAKFDLVMIRESLLNDANENFSFHVLVYFKPSIPFQ